MLLLLYKPSLEPEPNTSKQYDVFGLFLNAFHEQCPRYLLSELRSGTLMSFYSGCRASYRRTKPALTWWYAFEACSNEAHDMMHERQTILFIPDSFEDTRLPEEEI